MSKINLRDISSRAKQWDHPVKGLLKYSSILKQFDRDVLKLPKKIRELYCVSLTALALMKDRGSEWWINIPTQDPPDGFVMTLLPEKSGAMEYLRYVEVVEHRERPDLILDTIKNKMVEFAYDRDTILVCLILSPAVYNFISLANKLSSVPSLIKHIFVVFPGVSLNTFVKASLGKEQLMASYTMVQIFPKYNETTFDLRYYLQDYKTKYEAGRESRIIENGKIWYGTVNLNVMGK